MIGMETKSEATPVSAVEVVLKIPVSVRNGLHFPEAFGDRQVFVVDADGIGFQTVGIPN